MRDEAMAIRLIVSMVAHPGKGGELAKAFAPRIVEVVKEPGCEQYEMFQSAQHPDQLVLLERWTDAAMLDVHLALNRARGGSPAAPFRASSTSERYTTK